jgi:hypothetical protein
MTRPIRGPEPDGHKGSTFKAAYVAAEQGAGRIMAPTTPSFPVYIPSKSRAKTATTPRVFDRIGVPYRLVVEEQQYREYREHFAASKLLVLDPHYQATFDALGDFEGKSLGSGPARNFIWDHAVGEGHAWHWVVDDNIRLFARLHRNERIPVADGTIFAAMEDFAGRYENVAMAGPHYWMFALSRQKLPPFVPNRRVYSCNLIRNDVPFRWRGRYNEDVDLSLRMLKAGWCTILFNAFLQHKEPTQTCPGGNTEAFYGEEGTLPKSRMLAEQHPDVACVVWRYGRWHHYVDYRPFAGNQLKRRSDYEPPAENPYRFEKISVPPRTWVHAV